MGHDRKWWRTSKSNAVHRPQACTMGAGFSTGEIDVILTSDADPNDDDGAERVLKSVSYPRYIQLLGGHADRDPTRACAGQCCVEADAPNATTSRRYTKRFSFS